MSAEANVLAIQNPRVRTGMTGLVLFCLGHFFIDLYSSAMGAFQPLFVSRLHFTLTQAGILGGVMVFSGSFVQPVYGYLSDRFHSKMFSALAPAAAGIFIACLGLAWNFWTAAALIFLGGAGIASFHPQASARATLGIDSNRGRWMAVFISAGSLGLAVGPAYFTAITQSLGMERSWIGGIPGIFVTLLMVSLIQAPEAPGREARKKFDLEPLKAVKGPLTVLGALVLLRSGIQIVFGQFLPLYLYRERGFTLYQAALALSVFQIAGALGRTPRDHLVHGGIDSISRLVFLLPRYSVDGRARGRRVDSPVHGPGECVDGPAIGSGGVGNRQRADDGIRLGARRADLRAADRFVFGQADDADHHELDDPVPRDRLLSGSEIAASAHE